MLNWVDAGWLRFFARSAVARPDHLRKLVLFQWLGDQASMAIWRAAKFNTRAGTASELASGLRAGLYQACATSPQLASFNRTYEAARYMTDMNWALLLGATVVTTDAWNRIPEDVRPALVRAAQAAGARLREEIRKDGEVSIAAMKRAGATVVPVDAEAKAAWFSVATAAYPKIRGAVVPPDAFDEALKHRDDYRARKR